MNIYVIPVLALVTMAIVGFMALRSKEETEERRETAGAPKSALAEDGAPDR